MVALVFSLLLLPTQALPQQQTLRRLRLAVVGFTGNSDNQIAKNFLEALAQNQRLKLIEEAQIKPALDALRYEGAINLSRAEARSIGAAIGCDFFIIGKAEASRRSEAAQEAHEELCLGVMIVDSRSGALAHFDFILEKAATTEIALRQAAHTLAARLPLYLEKMTAFRAAQELAKPSSNEPVDEMPDTKSALVAGFKAPEFIHRVKPDYTDEADRADINATVEARVVFKASGDIGDIEIIRWAGFGLDEAAVRAIRQLKFKPAMRDGKAVNVRALIQYNFRRVNEK
ncbi:MAG: energy transducer TonB [Acidobacteria bacterium]|nr:energy transducer TonB [Acidobacteriota bacterium]